MQQERILETLRKCMFFNHLAEEQLRSVAAMGVMQSYGAGDELFRQGTLGTNLYILSRGQISLDREVRLGDSRKGIVSVHEARERPYRRLLGGWSALVGAPHVHMCTARCNGPAEVVSIPTERLRLFLEGDLQIRVRILERLVLLLKDRLESSYGAIETV